MRLFIAILIVAALIGGGLYLYNTDPEVRESVAEADMPGMDTGLEPASGSTSVTVPTDMDINRAEGEMPDVDIQTEEKTIDYPTLKSEDASDDAMDAEIEPVNEDPHDPIPPANETLDDDQDGNIDFNDSDETTDTDTAEDNR